MLLYMSTGITCRDGVFYFRARIPTHLVEAFGRPMVSVSLRTRCPQTAKKLARQRRVELDSALAALEPSKAPSDAYRGAVLFLSDADIEAACDRFRAARLTEDELQRIKGLRPSEHALDIDIFEAALPEMRLAYGRGDLTNVLPSVDGYLCELGLKLPKTSPSYDRLCRRFQQVEIEVYEAILQRRKGFAVPMPLAATDALTLDDVFSTWKRHKGSNAKSVRSFEQAFEEFRAHCLAPSASLVKKADAIAFRDALLDRGETGPQTVSKKIGFMRAAFQCAIDDDKLQVNPFAGVKVVVPERAADEKSRLPFTAGELRLLFSSRLYQPSFQPRDSLGTACQWLPPLALFSGARLEELGQLTVSDIQQDDDLGWYVCIRRAVDGSKRTKNLNSIRRFPLHPRLVALGFLDYVKACKAGRLFPALRADKYGILTTSFSTWFGGYLDEVGITDSTRVFHSFRHSFIQRAKERATQVPTEVREAIVGHMSAKRIEMVYGSAFYPLEPQASAMVHVDWPELDLKHLRLPGRQA
jgi:integrase